MIAHTANPDCPLEPPRRFQVLALSGGGYRGLYTAKVIADLEDMFGAQIATRFDLIAGTSVGGILALALALESPAARIVELFISHGAEIFAKRVSIRGIFRAPYSSANLRALLAAQDLFGTQLLGACKHPVIIPAINYSTGQLVAFKTSHHSTLVRDHKMPLVDVALATSAAPDFSPRHVYASSQYVDGGLVANAPWVLALHEATEYFDRKDEEIHLMSVGTMSSRSTVNPQRTPTGGLYDWGDGTSYRPLASYSACRFRSRNRSPAAGSRTVLDNAICTLMMRTRTPAPGPLDWKKRTAPRSKHCSPQQSNGRRSAPVTRAFRSSSKIRPRFQRFSMGTMPG
jgi:predicted acylesterase/phospholipase RssA